MMTFPPLFLILSLLCAQGKHANQLMKVKQLLKQGDSWAAMEYIESQGSSVQVATLYDAATVHFLRKEKDVPAFVRLSQAGIQYGLTMAGLSKDPKKAYALRSAAKVLAYNLSANVWQGWGKRTYPATLAQQRLGLDAARLNLRLAQELEKGALPISYGHWMLAASHLGLGNYMAAKEGFLAAEAAAKKAKDPAIGLSARGFLAVTMILSGKAQKGREALTKVMTQLAQLSKAGNEDAVFFAEQFDPALKAFGAKGK